MSRERDGLGMSGMRHPDTMWKVARVEDGAELGRYASKPKALAAAVRFGADGCAYKIIEAPADTVRERIGVVVPMRNR
jgi:hypothetical protein